MRTAVLSFLAITLLGGTILVPQALGDEWNQATKLTFNEAFEVPGQTLPAGTYWFRLLDSPSNREIVEIFNAGRSKLCATVISAPILRSGPSSDAELRFAERRHDKPEAIMAWFYPGMQTGHEFLYKSRDEKRLDRDPQQDLMLRGSQPAVMVPHGE